jgi:hypothetical protein
MQTSNGNSNGTNGQSTAITRPNADAYAQSGAQIERRGFGSQELEQRRETQGIAAAETAKALVQARFIMAMQRPRDFLDVRSRLLKHCQRPRFAEIAEYSKPVGGQSITGPSIRFVETALQEYGNVTIDTTVVYDDEEKRVVRVSVADLERNLPYTEDATVEKYVERRNVKGGDEVISERKNKQGATVYRVRATEDDYANKLAAAVSKKIRNLGLRILPADLVDEAMEDCAETRRNKDAADPDAAIRKMADAFARFNITPVQLKEYLGHELGQATPDEIEALRKIGTAIRDGETTWQATLDARKGPQGEAASTDKVGDKLKDKLANAPAKDKQPAEKPKPRTAAAIDARRRGLASAIEWSRNGDRHLGCVEDLELAVEQTGPTTWGWWLTRAGEEIEDGDALDLETAKGKGLEAAAKLEPPR